MLLGLGRCVDFVASQVAFLSLSSFHQTNQKESNTSNCTPPVPTITVTVEDQSTPREISVPITWPDVKLLVAKLMCGSIT